MADRILILEDERITAEDLAETLINLGYEVTAVVSSGADAIAEVERNSPDLVLMDIRIKGPLDGADTAMILRDRFDLGVIFLTSHGDRETLSRAKRSRPSGYLIKPFLESELQANIEIALHSSRVERQGKGRKQHERDVLSAMTPGVLSVDLHETVLVVNPAAAALTGWREPDAARRFLHEVLRLEDIDSGLPFHLPLRQVMQGGALTDIRDKLLVSRGGERIRIAGSIAPVRGVQGSITGAVIMLEAVPAGAAVPASQLLLHAAEKVSTLEFGRFHMIAVSEKMKQAIAFAGRVARSQASVVLLEGESGTGKDLIAQFLHHSGNRSGKPFVPINCAAIPDALLESELFGHEAGAFSDARTQKKGLFEIARGGTLFLDEIGEVSPAVQAKLLRVLETHSFRRLGGIRDIEMDVRVVSATNRFLAHAVQENKFRLDLFHRLSIIQMTLPALRERPEDILPMARHFMREFASKYGARVEGIAPDAARALAAHDWPGNVRELRNVIERAVLTDNSGMIQAGSITFALRGQGTGRAMQGDLSLKNSQRGLIAEALERAGGNKTKAAAMLGISRDVLRYRMHKLKIEE